MREINFPPQPTPEILAADKNKIIAADKKKEAQRQKEFQQLQKLINETPDQSAKNQEKFQKPEVAVAGGK